VNKAAEKQEVDILHSDAKVIAVEGDYYPKFSSS
jgi:hypothetical protein